MSTLLPAWSRGQDLSLHRGTGPLGIEAVTTAIVEHQLPGITNGTWRIRYYSFFSWVLLTFHQRSGTSFLPRSAEGQR
jgi:hypothetical protein